MEDKISIKMAMNVMPLMCLHMFIALLQTTITPTTFSYVGSENGFHDRFIKKKIKNKNTLFNQHTKRIAQGPFIENNIKLHTSYHKITGLDF